MDDGDQLREVDVVQQQANIVVNVGEIFSAIFNRRASIGESAVFHIEEPAIIRLVGVESMVHSEDNDVRETYSYEGKERGKTVLEVTTYIEGSVDKIYPVQVTVK